MHIYMYMYMYMHVCRSQPAPEWPAQAVHEGSLCGAVPDGPCQTQRSTALPAHADAPSSLRPQWIEDAD